MNAREGIKTWKQQGILFSWPDALKTMNAREGIKTPNGFNQL